MKKFSPILLILVVVVIMLGLVLVRSTQQEHIAILEGNINRQPVPVKPGLYQDAQCAMTLNQVEDSAQAVDPDGRTWFFDDVGCLVLWLHQNPAADEMVLWVYDRATGDWTDARTACYLPNQDTPMAFGYAALGRQSEGCIDFQEMSRRILRDNP